MIESIFVIFCLISIFNDKVYGGLIVVPPKLECMENGLRVHFNPSGIFNGHIYVKGFFFSQYCHLDYANYQISTPFYFQIPYDSECNVKKEKTTNPNGINYSVTIVVQNHKLFLTDNDQAYQINCFFRENRTEPNHLYTQKIQINDVNETKIDNNPLETQPICNYQVLGGSENGTIVQFASIGEILFHKWTCETSEMGMLVHSCIVKDSIQNSFKLIDERGCVTDNTLMHPLNYSITLNSVYAPIPAFKFADQMMLFFSCQITLCKKTLNGCEGITPPLCNFLKLPDEGGLPIPIINKSTNSDQPLITLTEEENSRRPFMLNNDNLFIPPLDSSSNIFEKLSYNNNVVNSYGYNSSFSPTTRNGRDVIRGVVQKPNSFIEINNIPKSSNKSLLNDTITLDVVADQLIVFAKDDAMKASPLTNSNILYSTKNCHYPMFPLIIFIMLSILTFGILIVGLLCQRKYYEKKIEKWHGFFTPLELNYQRPIGIHPRDF